MEKMVKTAMGFSYLVPIMVEEVLPGDTWKAHITTVARTAVPIVPLMDNWHLEYFAFFVPNRLLWTNWVKFMGEQDNPGDSISYTIPVCNPTTGYAVSSLQDYMGLITTGQNNETPGHTALPLRAYNQIYNAWFRDENLQNSVAKNVGDGPDSTGDYVLLKRGKRKDYFTGALPWPQKGNAAVTLPLGTTAPVNVAASIATGNSVRLNVLGTTTARQVISQNSGTGTTWGTLSAAGQAVEVFADLSTATAATINQLRQSFQIQRLLERDARGGTRYTEIIRSHFGVISPDARLNARNTSEAAERRSSPMQSHKPVQRASQVLLRLWERLRQQDTRKAQQASPTAAPNTDTSSSSRQPEQTSPISKACANCGADPRDMTSTSLCSQCSGTGRPQQGNIF